MKIIILSDTYLPYRGGGQIFVWEVARRLIATHKIKIEIVTRRILVDGIALGDEELYGGQLKITRLGWPAKWDNIFSRLWFLVAATFYVCGQDFDLVDAQAFISAIPGKLAAMLRHKPVILTVHGTTMETGNASRIERIILTKINYDAQISAAANFLKFDNINKNIVVVNPGVDTGFYTPDFYKRKSGRILFVGRLQKVKGTEVLQRCMKALSHTPYKIIIAGDGAEHNNIQNFIRAHKITNVEFKGELSAGKIVKEYQKASVFILPSLSEGFPLTILEAMACGVPVVAFNVGDVGKMMTDGVNGYVVPAGDTGKFMEKIKLILSHRDLTEEISQNNALKSKQYSWEKTADKIYHVYKQVMSTKYD